MATEGGAMDWPLSQEEKKTQVMRLYNQDVKAADQLIQAGNSSVQTLQSEVEAIRSAIEAQGILVSLSKETTAVASRVEHHQDKDAEMERLRGAVESATALLRAMSVSRTCEDTRNDLEEDVDPRCHGTPLRCHAPRCRSEGGLRSMADLCVPPLKSALSRTPRTSRCATPRRVSFGRREEVVTGSDSEVEDRCQHGNNHQHVGESLNSLDIGESPERTARRSADEAEPEPEEDLLHEPCTIVLPELRAGRDVSKLGFVVFSLPPEEMRIKSVAPGSWAEKSGIQPEDVIVVVNGKRVQFLNGARTMEILKNRPLRLLLEREGPLDPPSPLAGESSPRLEERILPDDGTPGVVSSLLSWFNQ
jgi:hypothetical protein